MTKTCLDISQSVILSLREWCELEIERTAYKSDREDTLRTVLDKIDMLIEDDRQSKCRSPRYALIGETYETGYYMPTTREEGVDSTVVALFTTKAKAKEYVQRSILKRPTKKNKFKTRSLLYGYDNASVERFDPPKYELLDIDPKI